MSCTSKWRWPITRRAALAHDGERLGEEVVEEVEPRVVVGHVVEPLDGTRR